uniref:Galectin n=1 Tax=Amphimedon queenslandica TaxID=400682 RepID=A0A1X7ULM3_AMPQE
MHSFVCLFLSALLIFSASAANLYQQDEPEFAATEDESQFDAMESEVDDQDQEQTQAMTQMEAFYNMIPKVQEPSGSQDLSNIQATVSESIAINHFFIGRSIEVRYITPSTGRPTMDLYDAHGNIILHVNPRWDTRAFVLNTLHNKRWGREERPSGFDFSSGVPITVRVEAHHSHFVILVNGRILHHYRHRLNINTLRHIAFNWGGSSFKPTKLINLSVYY